MDLQVFDTWIEGSKGGIHIDVLVPKDKKLDDAIKFGKEFLKSIGEEGAKMTTEECTFCHIQKAIPEQEKEVNEKGYFIIKMQGC